MNPCWAFLSQARCCSHAKIIPICRSCQVSHFEQMDTDESVRLIVNGHPTKILPMQGQDHLHISLRKPKEGQMTYKYTFDGQLEHPDKTEGGIENTAEGGAKLDGQDNNVVHGPEVVEAPPFQSNIVINNQQKKSKVESDVLQLPDSLIPGKKCYSKI